MDTTTKNSDGTFNITGTFTTPIIFASIGQEFIYEISKIEDLIQFTKFSEIVSGVNNTRTLERFWRLGYDDCHWSDWYSLPIFNSGSGNNNLGDFRAGIYPLYPEGPEIQSMFDEFPGLNSRIDYQLEIKWVRSGTNPDGLISLTGFELEGLWNREELTSPVATVSGDNYRDPIYIRPADVYKVFRLDDVEILASGETPDRQLKIEYRISQNNWRTATPWEELTSGNISTTLEKHKISPIRFFWIEYRVSRMGTDTSNNIKLHDINLIGDFQNVSVDATKTNLLGIRECCSGENSSNLYPDDVTGFNSVNTNGGGSGESCLPENLANPLGNQELANLWNPYNLNKAVDLYNSLSNSTNEMFGWEVDYFLTDFDKNGIDYTLHEVQLKNVVKEGKIKVSVDENQFPDNQITFNQFDLSLFDSFEIHITKDTFKRAFGVDQRPSKDDFLAFCELNRIFQIEHAQPYRDFNNAAVYYKVILRKYNKKASVQAADSTLQGRIDELANNSDLDQLFGLEKQADKSNVANKDQHAPLTQDKVRVEFSAPVTRELISNGSLVINKYHYDLSKIDPIDAAVKYKKVDSYLRVGDNRSYSAWFNIPEYVVNETFNFIHNYDPNTNKGYKIDLYNGNFNVIFNDKSYSFPVTVSDNTWYCYTVNIDQRQRKITQYLYKRNVNQEVEAVRLKSSKLKLIASVELDLTIGEFEFDTDNMITILGSNMKLTNIRIYNEVIPEVEHNKVLNQNIIRDSEYLILADNSNKKYSLPNYGYN